MLNRNTLFKEFKLKNYNKYNDENSWPYYPKEYITYPSAYRYIELNKKVKKVFNKKIEEGAANNVNSSEKVPSSQAQSTVIGNISGESSKAFNDTNGSLNNIGLKTEVKDLKDRLNELEKNSENNLSTDNDIDKNKIKSLSSNVKSNLQKLSKEAKHLIKKLYPDLSEQPALISKGSNVRKESELLGKVALKSIEGLDSNTKSV